MTGKLCYFNGRIIPTRKASVNPYDIGVLRGYGVFDVMCTQNGKPFLLKEHFQRLENSARELKLKTPFSLTEYAKILEKLLKLNGFRKSTIRTVLTGGVSDNSFSIGKPTCYILIEKFSDLPPEIFEKGAGAITLNFSRHIPKAKITNYVEAIRNQGLKEKKKALEIIYIENGNALEASTSNFFIIKNGALATAKDGILLGMTRNLVITLARKKKLRVEERNISEKELREASEIFLTATNKDIVPIVKLDGKKIGNGKPGKITKELMEEFKNFTKNY